MPLLSQWYLHNNNSQLGTSTFFFANNFLLLVDETHLGAVGIVTTHKSVLSFLGAGGILKVSSAAQNKARVLLSKFQTQDLPWL